MDITVETFLGFIQIHRSQIKAIQEIKVGNWVLCLHGERPYHLIDPSEGRRLKNEFGI
ncbi:MAG TPA: hypothetical protein VFR09_02130 [Alphaproteobacteria bacterium]|nr:hypothetical protein [Alphaproteobacteria bacterium]